MPVNQIDLAEIEANRTFRWQSWSQKAKGIYFNYRYSWFLIAKVSISSKRELSFAFGNILIKKIRPQHAHGRDRPMLSIRYVFVLIFPTDDRYGQSSLNMVLFSYSLYRHHSFHRTLSSDKFISMCIESVSFNKHITASYHTILLISFHFFGTLLSCVMIFFFIFDFKFISCYWKFMQKCVFVTVPFVVDAIINVGECVLGSER